MDIILDTIEFSDDRFSKVCWAIARYFLWGATTMFIAASFVAFAAVGAGGMLHLIGQLILQ